MSIFVPFCHSSGKRDNSINEIPINKSIRNTLILIQIDNHPNDLVLNPNDFPHNLNDWVLYSNDLLLYLIDLVLYLIDLVLYLID